MKWHRREVDNIDRLLTFNLTVSGNVEVRLHFAELFWDSPGKLVFDVTAKGKTVMNLNTFAASGGAGNATTVSIRGIQVNDGKLLTLGFNAEVNYVSIAGIEVLRM